MNKVKRVIVGGTTYVGGDATVFHINRIKKWLTNSDPNPAVEAFTSKEAVAPDDVIRRIVCRTWGFRTAFIEAMQRSHQCLVKKIHDAVLLKHPDFAKVPPLELGGNYSDELKKIKSWTVPGWDQSDVKGFCQLEPAERILQLLTFPFEDYAVELPSIDMAASPPAPVGGEAVVLATGDAVMRFVEEHRDTIHDWEHFYLDVCESLATMCVNPQDRPTRQ